MATKRKTEEEVIVVEDKKEEVKVVKPKETAKPVEAKNVKVALNTNHRCYIGGHWYTFKEGVQYNVPVQVKEILKSAGKLAPL